MKELERTQAEFGRYITRSGLNIATDVVLWELGWLPIKDRVLVKREKFLRRLERIGDGRITQRVFEERREKGCSGGDGREGRE